jgi:hypothetical protein
MTLSLDELLGLLDHDRELLEQLFDAEILPRGDSFADEEAEHARVARTLVRELEVNWPGVEIILRLRSELIATRCQVADLVRLLHTRGK